MDAEEKKGNDVLGSRVLYGENAVAGKNRPERIFRFPGLGIPFRMEKGLCLFPEPVLGEGKSSVIKSVKGLEKKKQGETGKVGERRKRWKRKRAQEEKNVQNHGKFLSEWETQNFRKNFIVKTKKGILCVCKRG